MLKVTMKTDGQWFEKYGKKCLMLTSRGKVSYCSAFEGDEFFVDGEVVIENVSGTVTDLILKRGEEAT